MIKISLFFYGDILSSNVYNNNINHDDEKHNKISVANFLSFKNLVNEYLLKSFSFL